MSTTRIEHLPLETLSHIFKNFVCCLPTNEWWMGNPDRTGQATLKSLCLVSHTFRNAAQPLLFRNILMDSTDDGTASLVQLADVLADKPALGLNARMFSVPYISPSKARRVGFVPEDLSRRVLRRPDLSPRLRACLDKLCSEQRCFSPAIFCLIFMPNLQVVDVCHEAPALLLSWMLSGRLEFELKSLLDAKVIDRFYDDQGCDEDVRDETVPIRRLASFGLHNLKEIRCHHAEDKGVTSMVMFEGVFLHPGIEVVRSVGIDWRGNIAAKQQWPHSEFNIRVLDLKECIIDGPGLENVFQRCPLLEELSIELGHFHRATWINDDSWIIQLPEIGPVLKKHGTRLVKLDLHTVQYTHAFGYGFLGSLQGLKNIRHLGVLKNDMTGHNTYNVNHDNSHVLHLKEVLPRSVETLCLHYDTTTSAFDDLEREGMDQEIYDVITGGEFPSLRAVKVERFLGEDQPFGFTMKGWTSEIRQEHLWKRRSSSGCERTVMALSRTWHNS